MFLHSVFHGNTWGQVFKTHTLGEISSALPQANINIASKSVLYILYTSPTGQGCQDGSAEGSEGNIGEVREEDHFEQDAQVRDDERAADRREPQALRRKQEAAVLPQGCSGRAPTADAAASSRCVNAAAAVAALALAPVSAFAAAEGGEVESAGAEGAEDWTPPVAAAAASPEEA